MQIRAPETLREVGRPGARLWRAGLRLSAESKPWMAARPVGRAGAASPRAGFEGRAISSGGAK
eukprot:406904-Alexandrium_andersonii.AAC.1